MTETPTGVVAERPRPRNSIRQKITSMLAALGLACSAQACNKAQAEPGNMDHVAKEEQKATTTMAQSAETISFSDLSHKVQAKIQKDYLGCLDEVKDFASSIYEVRSVGYNVMYQDGKEKCDDIRDLDIGIAGEHLKQDRITASITTG